MCGLSVVVVGSAHMDFYVRLPRLPSVGETVLGSGFVMSPGGKGANQAVAAARLGARAYLVSRVGADLLGEWLLEGLRGEGVGVEFVRVDRGAHTGVAFILLEEGSGENVIAVAPGADSRVSASDVEEASGVIAGARVVLAQLEVPLGAVARACEIARGSGARVVLNPAPARGLPGWLYKLLDVITPNRVEAERLTGVRVSGLEGAREAAGVLLDRGVGGVVVTLGPGGALVATRRGFEHVPAFETRVVDTTGAGDAFNAALAVFLSEGYGLRESCLMASAAAAIKVGRLGAQAGLPTRGELEEFLRRRGVAV